MQPSMNRSALFVLLATATAAFGAQAHTYTGNARVLGAEPQYENVSVPRQECRSNWVTEVRPAEGRNYGGVAVGGLAGALLGNQLGRGHGREATTVVGAVFGALTGDNIANRGRFEQPVEPVSDEATSCRTVTDLRSRIVGYRVDYEYRGQRFSTLMQEQPGAFVPVRVSVEPVGR
jgi:uncharacterized protein YcfJ